jgi:ABC-type sugar transport system permease subunit
MVSLSAPTEHEFRAASLVFGILVLLVAAFAIVPVCELIWWSFTDKGIGCRTGQFVWLRNYAVFFSKTISWNVFRQTMIYTCCSIGLKLTVGFALALLLARWMQSSPKRFSPFVVGMFLLPWAVPTSASMFIWAWIFYDSGGILNALLRAGGIITKNISWLGTHGPATACLIIVNTWRGIGFFVATLLAARLDIPSKLYRIAELEGASNWTIFSRVTLPAMRLPMMIVVAISVISTYTDFQVVHILTDGGPGDSTQIFSTMVYDFAFRGRATLGYASAFAIMLSTVMMAAVVILLFSLAGRRGDGPIATS